MKDDLIKVLNFKLKQIKDNILELNRLNNEIKEETDKLDYIQQAISNFKSETHGFDIYKFSNIDHMTFNNLLMNLSDEVLAKFGTNSCNYDGLIYIINGINNGISLTLTQEQIDAINLFIDKLLEKEQKHQNVISDLNNSKQKLEFKELDELMTLENKYSLIIENIEDEKYVNEIDEVIEAINYSELSLDQTFDILCYLLKYNSEIYIKTKDEKNNEEEKVVEEEKIDLTKPFEETVESEHEVEKNIDLTDTEEVNVREEEKVINEELEENKNVLSFEETKEVPDFSNLSEEATEVETDNIAVDTEISDNEMEYNPVLPIIPEVSINPEQNFVVENSESMEKNANQEISVILPNVDVSVDDANSLNEDAQLVVNNDVLVDNNLSSIPEINIENEVSSEDENTVEENENVGTDSEVEMPINLGLPTTEESEIKESVETVIPIVNLVSDVIPDNNFVVTPSEASENVNFVDNQETDAGVLNSVEVDTKDESIALNLTENAQNNVDYANQVVVETNVENTPVEVPTEQNEVNELVELFDDYKLNFEELDENTKAILQNGNMQVYRQLLLKLDELEVLDLLKNDQSILIQVLLNSDASMIDKVVNIIGNDLSVDNNDKKITTEIVFRTIPSVFMKGENGNYDNFVRNVELLKEYGIDLINLFDFSREVFVVTSGLIENNYNIISGYDLTVNAYNAKYLLLLPNISSKLDYFVEAIYKDNSKNGHGDIFDGFDSIKLYPSRLNTVTNETMERLRYSSEKGLKIFGSKEKSLAAEIANLSVDVINMPVDYKKDLFNNEFDIIARDEVDKYIKLVNERAYVELNQDELLNKLGKYRDGIRYVIENINVSVNKVIRNYNILVNEGVDKTKALLFAICYNLIITKAEYEKIKTFVSVLGGN